MKYSLVLVMAKLWLMYARCLQVHARQAASAASRRGTMMKRISCGRAISGDVVVCAAYPVLKTWIKGYYMSDNAGNRISHLVTDSKQDGQL
jgi:hypothetical protein